MYRKFMFKTDRIHWKMHLSPFNLAARYFRVYCRWVILGGWVVKKNFFLVRTYVILNLVFFHFQWLGWECLNKIAQNVLKHALISEFSKSNDVSI